MKGTTTYATSRRWKVVSYFLRDEMEQGRITGRLIEWHVTHGQLSAKDAYSRFFWARKMPGPIRVELWRGKEKLLDWSRPVDV